MWAQVWSVAQADSGVGEAVRSRAVDDGSGSPRGEPEQAEIARLRAELSRAKTREGWLYVCAVLDLFTRRIVGWSIAEHMTRQLVLNALQMAHKVRKPAPGLIFHSDRGSQYASHEVRAWLLKRAMRQSMSGTGNCYDNAPMESYWHSMKVEELHGQDFATRAAATQCVFAYIEGWYNTTRLHSSLGYKSPAQFERERDAKSFKAANDPNIAVLSNNSQSARLKKRAA